VDDAGAAAILTVRGWRISATVCSADSGAQPRKRPGKVPSYGFAVMVDVLLTSQIVNSRLANSITTNNQSSLTTAIDDSSGQAPVSASMALLPQPCSVPTEVRRASEMTNIIP
jgi:hypothetical protein